MAATRARCGRSPGVNPFRFCAFTRVDQSSGNSVTSTGNTKRYAPQPAWHTADPPPLPSVNRIENVVQKIDRVGPAEPLTLEGFLAGVERKAFVIARLAVGNDDDALDIVQDAMLKLCEKYADRPANEWAPLFFRILDNRIVDRYRPRGFERLRRWMGPSGNCADGDQGGAGIDAVDRLPDAASSLEEQVDVSRHIDALNVRLAELPHRQRQVFLLRCWQGMGVEETARVLGISGGSVKTHLSRALATLGKHLGEASDE